MRDPLKNLLVALLMLLLVGVVVIPPPPPRELGAADEDGLSGELVVDWDERRLRGEARVEPLR